MKDKKLHIRKLSLFFLIMIFLIFVALVMYNNMLKKSLTSSQEKTLGEILEQSRFNFDAEIKAEEILMESLASVFSELEDDKNLVVSMLNKLQKSTNFESMAIVDVNGVGIATNGQRVNVSQHECFQGAVSGNFMFSESMESLLFETEVIHLAIPIYKQEKVVGVLVAAYEVGKLNKLLVSSFLGRGYAFVVNKEGEILAKSESNYVLLNKSNLFKSMEDVDFMDFDNLNDILKKIKAGKPGQTMYEIEGQVRYAQFRQLDMVDWYIFVVVPQEVIGESMRIAMRGTLHLTSCIIAIFICFLIYIFILQKKAREEETKGIQQLEKVAYYDELTGIPNFNKFKIDAQKIIENNPNHSFVTMKFDIVNFKMINEMFDFEIGNEIIRKAACFMETIISDTSNMSNIDQDQEQCKLTAFARINGDEFILLDLASTIEDIELRRTKSEDAFKKEIVPILGKYHVGFRYGRYFLEAGETNISAAIEKVNIAHRVTKEQSQKVVCDYNESFLKEFIKDTRIGNDMERALRGGEFKVYLQPKYDINTEEIIGAESLVRWVKKDGELIFPGDFIPFFEKNGFIVKLDYYMFEEVSKLIQRWIKEDRKIVSISVNFSRLHLDNPTFVQDIYNIANKYNIPTKYLEIELTESIVSNNEELFTDVLKQLHAYGFRLSMDDFGTGYSSLGLLKNIEVDIIKMDRSFFNYEHQGVRAKMVLESVMQMAQKLNIYTVAEGVETKKDILFLREIGCDSVQGYYYAKPMPVKDYENLLK